jgi:DNA-binding NarL/FixJ family response regulator
MGQLYKRRMVVADRLEIVLAGLCAVLARDTGFLVVGEASDGASLVQTVGRLAPDGVLMDAALDGDLDLQLIRETKHRCPSTKVALITPVQSRDQIIEGLRAGADGYIARETTINGLLTALGAVLDGQTYLSPQVVGQVVWANSATGFGVASPGDRPGLSQRERQVLRLVATGHTNKEVGDHLFISARTVEKHRATLMHKLHAPNTAALVAFAISNGLVSGDEGTASSAVDSGPRALAAGTSKSVVGAEANVLNCAI